MKCSEIKLHSYKNALPDFHVHKVSGSCKAQKYHYHDYFQIYYIRKGHITHQTEFGSAPLCYGDAFIIPPNYKHAIVLNTPNAEFYSCSFSRSFIETILLSETKTSKFLASLSDAEHNVALKLSIPSEKQIHLQNFMEFLLFEYEHERSKESLVHCLSAVLCLLCNIKTDVTMTSETEKQDVLQCLIYIKSNLEKKISLQDIVKQTHMQKKDFCLLLKKISGFTFNEYLNKMRVEKAIEMLKSPQNSTSLAIIAERCGYENYITFYRNFLNQTGITPTQFQTLLRNS